MTTKITASKEFIAAQKLSSKINALNMTLCNDACSIDEWERQALMLFDQIDLVLWRLLQTIKKDN
jgi:hypothetical protein